MELEILKKYYGNRENFDGYNANPDHEIIKMVNNGGSSPNSSTKKRNQFEAMDQRIEKLKNYQ